MFIFLRQEWLDKIKRVTGLDRAIGYTVLARGLQIIGSTGTVLLIVRFLSPVEQGYYYTLWSLVSLYVIFELGFSFVILQLAAHESAALVFLPDGTLKGDAKAHCRLASVLQKTVSWYLVAGGLMLGIMLPLGSVFFSKHRGAADQLLWQGPWACAVVATIAVFVLNPIFSFFEGCGQIVQVAWVRMLQGIATILAPWSVLIAGYGLYAPGAVNVGLALVGGAFVLSGRRRRLLTTLLCYDAQQNPIKWRTEVWPFQWRLAISYLCTYFTTQIFVPILFTKRGPIEAGRMGMSLSVAGYLWVVPLAWMSTKAATFGQLVARSEFEKLDVLFFRTLKQSLSLMAVLGACCIAGFRIAQHEFPGVVARVLPLPTFSLLLLTSMSIFVAQAEAIYLRAYKSEPFLLQSIVVGVLTCGAALALTPIWGMTGAAVTYFLCSGLVGLVSATMVFQRRTRISQIEVIK